MVFKIYRSSLILVEIRIVFW